MSDEWTLDQFQETFDPLDPSTRAWAMVGCYMSWFAMMESDLSRAISLAIGVPDSRYLIVTRNLGFIEKVRTFRSCLEFVISEPQQSNLHDLCKKMEKEADTRNSIAHRVFLPNETGDGVVFHITEARKQLRIETEEWRVKDLFEHIKRLDSMCNELTSRQTTSALEGVSRFFRRYSDQKKAPNALVSWILPAPDTGVDTD